MSIDLRVHLEYADAMASTSVTSHVIRPRLDAFKLTQDSVFIEVVSTALFNQEGIRTWEIADGSDEFFAAHRLQFLNMLPPAMFALFAAMFYQYEKDREDSKKRDKLTWKVWPPKLIFTAA